MPTDNAEPTATLYRVAFVNGLTYYVAERDAQPQRLANWWPVQSVTPARGRCGWANDGGWSLWRCGLPEPCPEHADAKCRNCGGKATHGCPHTGSFVCGFPACDDCGCCSPGHGARTK